MSESRIDQLRAFDLAQLPESGILIGIDEAGRGALAGPVVAAAVVLDAAILKGVCPETWLPVNDSKQLTPERREAVFESMEASRRSGQLRWAAGVASVEEIERKNILGATMLAMRRALEAAVPDGVELPRMEEEFFVAETPEAPATCILIDGRPLRPFPYRHEGVVKGDACSFAIALASIAAKVTRDRMMCELHREEGRYGFQENKGYGTSAHRRALLEHGPVALHRRLFLRKLLGGRNDDQGMREGLSLF